MCIQTQIIPFHSIHNDAYFGEKHALFSHVGWQKNVKILELFQLL